MLLAERGELFAEAAEQHGCLRGGEEVERVTTLGHTAVTGILL